MKTNNTLLVEKKTQNTRYINYRKKWKVNAEQCILDDFPIHLDIETSTGCDLRCKMCVQGKKPEKQKYMPKKILDKIIDEASKYHLQSVKLQYRGEPILDPRLPEIIKRFKRIGVIDIAINTNANKLDVFKFAELQKAGLTTLICSVDGYTKTQYEKYRIGGNFEKVLANIKQIHDYKKQNKIELPKIRLQTIDKACDINSYKEFWGKYADEISVNGELNFQDEKLNKKKAKWKCSEIWHRLFVLYDGTILPCCRAVDKQYKPLIKIGNILNTSLYKAWHSLTDIREIHEKENSHEVEMCQQCAVRKYVLKNSGKVKEKEV